MERMEQMEQTTEDKLRAPNKMSVAQRMSVLGSGMECENSGFPGANLAAKRHVTA